MKQLLITIVALVLVGCGKSQQSATAPEPPTAKAPDISIVHDADLGFIKLVKQHLAAGTDVNTKENVLGLTSLHQASSSGHKEIAELLISEGADVNAKDDVEYTPLHGASRYGHKEVAELLIANGADLNAQDNLDGKTPLDWAIAKDETKISDLLRKHGGKTAEELKAEGE